MIRRTITHSVSGSSFTLGDLRAFLETAAALGDATPVSITVEPGDRPFDSSTTTLRATGPA